MVKPQPFYHKVSRLFQPHNIAPVGTQIKSKDMLSKSYKLMVEGGIIAHSNNGFFYLLPLATRALDKLTQLVDHKMTNIGSQKVICPTLTSSDIWEKTDRLSLAGTELFKLKDRHNKNYILSPTHEESMAHLLASFPNVSYKQLPLMLYQNTTKFRDEKKPRFGLIRMREFLMSDLYSFDSSEEAAKATYERVSEAYNHIFEAIGINFVKVKGESGLMGGEVSHEFHYPANIGDDTLRVCESCSHSWNKAINSSDACQQCSGNNIKETKGIEVGHMFQLGTRYSTPLQALYTGSNGKEPLVMGSYGLGLSRILAASLEILSLPDQIRWPSILAPYTLLIITPKEGSIESKKVGHLSEQLYWDLQEVPELENNVIIDDRSHLTIGKRLQEARLTGYPYIAVVGKAAATSTPPMIELLNVYSGQTSLHSTADLISTLVHSNQKCRESVSQ